MTSMRAKVYVSSVVENFGQPAEEGAPGNKLSEKLRFNAVSKKEGYDATGDDENNTFAKWSPSAEFEITVANPALWGKFKEGNEYYVDFSLVVMEDLVVVVPTHPPALITADDLVQAALEEATPAADAPATE